MSEKLIRARLTCESLSPLLMNRMSDQTLDSLFDPTKRKQGRTDITYQQVAEPKIYTNGDGKTPGIPAENMFACLVNAGRKVRTGRGRETISTATTTMLPEMLTILDTFMPFTGSNGDGPQWVVDKRRGVMKSGQKEVAVCVVRPKFPVWGFEVEIEFDESKISKDRVSELFRVAGSSVGLCDFRPQKKGPFGRFTVVKWKTISETDTSKGAIAA